MASRQSTIGFMIGKADFNNMLLRITTICWLSAAVWSAPSAASHYYFSAAGNDLTGNGSLANPWQTVAKFNTLDLDPGDHVYFRAGDTFDGRLTLTSSDSGTNAFGQLIAPVTIQSYGGTNDARAVIRSPATVEAFYAQNAGGIELRNLEFVNGGNYSTNSANGVRFESTSTRLGTLTHYQHIIVDNIVARGFRQSGLSLNAVNNVGYDGVTVSGGEFYDNQYSGVNVAAANWTNLLHRNLRINGVEAYNNPGRVGCSPHCGHGIVVSQVDGAVIENSVAHSNGMVAGAGNVGIWTWQANNVTIQHNVAYGNRSPLGADGGGFDIDGGVTNSVIQYNLSHDNEGAGYLLAQFAFANPMSQNVYRYNLSVNDGRDSYGGITIWGASPSDVAKSAVFHNNTVIVDGNVAPNSRGPVWFLDGNHSDISLVNNIFVATNGADLIGGTTTASKANFVRNAYWTDGSPVRIGGTTYTDIAQWSTLTQQERLNGHFVGLQADPKFLNDGTYRLSGASGLIDAGYMVGGSPWPAWLSGLGPHDIYGVPLPRGAGVEIGAAEFVPIAGDYNGDGLIDAADYHFWRSQLGTIVVPGRSADGNGNGVVDGADYIVWRTLIATKAGAAFQNSVPEPASWALLLAVLPGTLSRRRRLMR